MSKTGRKYGEIVAAIRAVISKTGCVSRTDLIMPPRQAAQNLRTLYQKGELTRASKPQIGRNCDPTIYVPKVVAK